MNFLRRNSVAVLLAVLTLVGGMEDVSEVLCVSPAGHEAVEAWSALGCRPGPVSGSAPAELSKPSACDGCTDYSLMPAAEFRGRKAVSERAGPHTPAVVAGNVCPISLSSGIAIHPASVSYSPSGNPPPVSLRC